MAWRGLAAALALASPAASAAAAADARIGTWVLACPPAGAPCVLRLGDALLPAVGGVSAALEVQLRGDALVPVVMLRGLPPAVAAGSILAGGAMSLRFDGGAPVALRCAFGQAAIACAPDGGDLAKTAAALPAARDVAVQLRAGASGMSVPPLDRRLSLVGTADALDALRTRGAAGEAVPAAAGLDWRGVVDRVLRAAGFERGLADLLPWVMRLLGSRG